MAVPPRHQMRLPYDFPADSPLGQNFRHIEERFNQFDEAAPHTHPEFDEFALKNHDHDGVYSPVSHNHNTLYAPVSHDHDGVYAPVSHNHNTLYAPVSHNHDGVYAPVSHNHNTLYAPLLHDHSQYLITNQSRDPRLPWGIVGHSTLTANTTPVGNTVTDSGLAVSFNATSGRFYVARASLHVTSTAVNDIVRVYISNAANANIAAGARHISAASTTHEVSILTPPLALSGAQTLKVRYVRHSGTGNARVLADAGVPATLIVEDVGPA